MSTQTTHDDVRIVDSFDDGGKLVRRAPMLGALTGLAVTAALVAIAGRTAWWLAPALLVAASAAGHDLRSGRLPDRLVGATGLLGLAAAVATLGAEGPAASVIGALALGAPLLVVHLASPCSMPFGDVKFALAIGGPLGIVGTDTIDRLFLAMIALTLGCGVAVLGAVALGRRHPAFGPWLFLGVSTALVFAAATRNRFG